MPSRRTPVRSAQSRRLQRLALVTIAVGTAAAVAACGPVNEDTQASDQGNKPSATASPAPKGAVSEAQASKILDRYVSVNNRANKARDAKLLGTVEGGQVYEQSKADYTELKTGTAEERQKYGKPFYYQQRRYYIPAGADWFAARAVAKGLSKGSSPSALLIFDQVDGSWKLVAAVRTEDLPQIDTSRSGLATEVSATHTSGTLAPDSVRHAFEDLFVTGGKQTGSKLSHTTAVAKSALKIHRDRNSGKNSRFATTTYAEIEPRFTRTYSLRLKGGGALTVSPTAHKSTYELKPEHAMDYDISPNTDESVFNPLPRDAVVNTYEGMLIARLPESGTASVIGREYRMVDSQ
ncbi:hypothetical protein [Streptomyces sp. NBC_01304]|uniref:hypothetical protein n=1 Tax=Streptomyces sp. NBC_01304 TaxID=2903818 RepID=UPI002E166D68|nr:hypothetical protein OG430_40790 [Streptomyces sp. NBC_01304]